MQEQNGFKEGEAVFSTINPLGVKYRIVKLFKTCCWVEWFEKDKIMRGGKWIDYSPVYKGVPYSQLRKAA